MDDELSIFDLRNNKKKDREERERKMREKIEREEKPIKEKEKNEREKNKKTEENKEEMIKTQDETGSSFFVSQLHGMESLPRDIWIEIFSYLPWKDLCRFIK